MAEVDVSFMQLLLLSLIFYFNYDSNRSLLYRTSRCRSVAVPFVMLFTSEVYCDRGQTLDDIWGKWDHTKYTKDTPPKSTILKILQELQNDGWITQDEKMVSNGGLLVVVRVYLPTLRFYEEAEKYDLAWRYEYDYACPCQGDDHSWEQYNNYRDEKLKRAPTHDMSFMKSNSPIT